MIFDIEVSHLSLKYKKFEALKDISFTLENGKIYGLIGRNGAGKTSLLSLLASLREASEGWIKIAGENPFENYKIMQNVTFVHETNYTEESYKVQKYIALATQFYPNYNQEYADYLIKRFKLPINKPVNKLSKGMQSVMDVIIGMASRAPITIFDEAYLGMDAPTRKIFYQEVLEDQEKHPRIIILSTHLVSEMDFLFDEVLILHNGSLLVKEDYETLVSRGATITGLTSNVDAFVVGKRIIGKQQLGNTKAVTIYEENMDKIEEEARRNGLTVGPISLQDLFIYLTDDEEVA
ncbi:MAG: ABC transporter ATP-binding protein [Clostridiales bacterium]|nr:ABC transporter ATP-binding protein [Clostridiales bacterium]